MEKIEFERRHFDIIDSTNTWAKQNAAHFARDKITLVTAEGQTEGRGRFKRKWESPPGLNIYASFCLFVSREQSSIMNIPHILALSVLSVLQKLGFHPEIKWPNDLIISKKKVGGSLSEIVEVQDQLCMIIGLGLNVNMDIASLAAIDKPATSLLAEKGHLFDIEDILHSIKRTFSHELSLFFEQGFAPFIETYKKHVVFTGPVKFNDFKTIWEGDFEKIGFDGSLTLKLTNGELKTFRAGEIIS